MDGYLLVSGSEDGMVRVWDTRTRNIFRVFRHAKGIKCTWALPPNFNQFFPMFPILVQSNLAIGYEYVLCKLWKLLCYNWSNSKKHVVLDCCIQNMASEGLVPE